MATQIEILRNALNNSLEILAIIRNYNQQKDRDAQSKSEMSCELAVLGIDQAGEILAKGAESTSELMPEIFNPEHSESLYLPLTRGFNEQEIQVRLESGIKNMTLDFGDNEIEYVKQIETDLRAALREMAAQRDYARQYAEVLDLIEAKMKSVIPNTDLPFMTHVENMKRVVSDFANVWKGFKNSEYTNLWRYIRYEADKHFIKSLFADADGALISAEKTPLNAQTIDSMPTLQIIGAVKSIRSDNTDGENDVEHL